MSDLPSNAGTIGNIVGTAGIGGIGLAAVALGMGPGAAFLIFGTAFLQGFGSSMKLQGEIDDEIKRQQAICDQIKFSQDQLDKINGAIAVAQQTTYDEQQLEGQIGQIADDIKAQTLNIQSMKTSFKTKLLINIVIYILIVAILILIIILKKSS